MITDEQFNMLAVNALTEYLSEDAKKDKLYIAVLLNDTSEVERLRAEGAVLSEHIRGMLKNGGGSLAKPNEYGNDWYSFAYGLADYTPEVFVSVIRNLYAELGEPIYFSNTVFEHVPELYSAEVFRCVLDCFDNKKITKSQMLYDIIKNNMTEQLNIAAEHGWIRLAKKCDEYIEFAQECNSVECTALLMDYKNKSFDAAHEREKAEKRNNAELNASPDSVMMMKKLWTYRKLEDGTIAIKRYKGDKTEIAVPEKIGKDPVTALKVNVYDNGLPRKSFVSEDIQEKVTKVTLPKGLVSVGDGVFSYFRELREINIPDGVLTIGDNAFLYCEKLRTLTLPESVKEIGYSAFYSCYSLEKINLPRGITKLNDCVFESCGKLKAVEIPESVRSIGEEAFYDCGSIRSIIIPSGVTEINEHTFANCYKLTRIELPDTIEKINSYAFSGCSSLKELVIPEGVREIGYAAFGYCKALERVVLPASLKKAKNYYLRGTALMTIFYESPNVTAVVTPKSYAEKYCKRNGINYIYKENQT